MGSSFEAGFTAPKTPEVQEQKKYRIMWKSRLTGTTGNGEYVDEEIARAWLEKANKEHPEIEHWLEPEDEKKLADKN